jgi:hypothetical protein
MAVHPYERGRNDHYYPYRARHIAGLRGQTEEETSGW